MTTNTTDIYGLTEINYLRMRENLKMRNKYEIVFTELLKQGYNVFCGHFFHTMIKQTLINKGYISRYLFGI